MHGLFLLLAVVALLGAVTTTTASPSTELRRPDGVSSIEWRYVADTHSLLLHAYTSGLHSPRSQLFPYSPDTSVDEFLQSSLVKALVADHPSVVTRCKLVRHSAAAASIASSSAGSLLAVLQVDPKCALKCSPSTAAGASWTFVQHTPQVHHPNEVRARNALHRAETGEDADYPMDAAELLSEGWAGVWGWASAFVKYHWGALHPYNTYEDESTTQTGRWHLNTGAILQPGEGFGAESDSIIRIGIVADWGAGTREADYVQQVMMNGNGTAFDPHWTLHVGDVYYVGDPDAIKSNCLGVAPAGVKQGVTFSHGSIGSFAVQGNHEMLSRGYGFFDTFLPRLGVTDPVSKKVSGQAAGYVAMENAYWRIIMLDTGYTTYDAIPGVDQRNNTQPQEVLEWLKNVVNIGNDSDTRGIIFMTHHQVTSAFEKGYLATPSQIAEMISPNRTVLWLWGHEHRVAWYDLFQLPSASTSADAATAASAPLSIYGRCMGNSGFPSSVTALPPRAKESGLLMYDDRIYELETGFATANVSYNGFVHLTLQKGTASLTYSSLATDPATGLISNKIQVDLVSEVFEVDENGSVFLASLDVLNPDLTIVS